MSEQGILWRRWAKILPICLIVWKHYQINLTIFLSFQNVEDGKEFFKRKIDFLTKQIEKIQPALQEKHAMKQGDFTYLFVYKTPAQIVNALNKSFLCLQQLLWKSWIWSFSSCTANKHHSLAPLKPKTVPSSMAENSGEILSVYLSDGSILNPWNGEPLLWCQNVHISLGGEGRPSLCLHQTTNQFFCSMFSLSCLVNKWSIGHSLAISTKPPSTGINVFGGDLLCGTTWLCCKHLLWIFLFIKYFECKYLHLKSAKEKVLAFLKANLQKCTSICIWLLVFSCQNNKKIAWFVVPSRWVTSSCYREQKCYDYCKMFMYNFPPMLKKIKS